MTDEQAGTLRALVADALFKTLGKRMAFVIVAQEENGMVEVFTNAKRRDLLPALLNQAADMVREPPAGTVRSQ